MPDITKCTGEQDVYIDVPHVCPLRHKCFRFTSRPSEHRQAMASFLLDIKEDKECEYFIQNKEQ